MAAIKLNSEIHPHDIQVDLAATMPTSDLLPSVLGYNWDMYPADVLSVIADRKDCSLLTALEIFCHAEPAYFEQQDNCGDPDILAMLHNIHDRVNKGGYVHDPRDHLRHIDPSQIKNFLTPRDAKDVKKLNILWQFNPDIVLPALTAPEEIRAEITRNRMALTESQRKRAESSAIDIYSESDSDRKKLLLKMLVFSSRQEQDHVVKLLSEPSRIEALIKERQQVQPDILNLPEKSHAHATRVSQLAKVETEQDLLRRFDPSVNTATVLQWDTLGSEYWYAGFEIEDMVKEFGDHPDLILNDYLTRLTEKYASPGNYCNRYTYFRREPKAPANTLLNKLLNKVFRRKKVEDGLWARYIFDDTMMFVGLSDYLTGSSKQARMIEEAVPISDALKQFRRHYQQSVETFEKKLQIAKKFQTEIRKFLDKDDHDIAWESRPRWSLYRQKHL